MATAAGTPRGRAAALTHTALLTALLLLIATVALVVRAPAPPSIAEFAPEAVKQIKKAPNDQSSEFGSGDGECELGQVCDGSSPPPSAGPSAGPGGSTGASPSPTAGEVIDVARVRRCVGNPPRQIEDPQSPPCVAYWKGDNGGATYQGVTKTTIKIAMPVAIPYGRWFDDLVDFFNRRFEFYGRKIVVEPFSPGGVFSAGNPTTMSAAAIQVDKEIQAFASTNYLSFQVYGQDEYYADELARRGIISVTAEDTFRTERENFDKRGLEGFEWSFLPSLDSLELNLATWTCQSLVGKPPTKAGQPYYPGTPIRPVTNRRFGIVQERAFNKSVDITVLKQGLAACGVNPTVIQVDAPQDDRTIATQMAQLDSEQVSTVICVCFTYGMAAIQNQATQQNYQPEWLTIGVPSQVSDGNANPNTYRQSNRTFGIDGNNKGLPLVDTPFFWAVREQDPSADPSQFPNAVGDDTSYHSIYRQMLLLASGIQMAGPNLTPKSFRDGLMAAEFPNPGAGAAPYYQARVGFSPGNHGMSQDVGLVYFDSSQRSRNGGPGSVCYVDRGKRYSLTTWVPVPDSKFYPGGVGRPVTERCY